MVLTLKLWRMQTEIQCINILMLQLQMRFMSAQLMQKNMTAAGALRRTAPDPARGACSPPLDPRADCQGPIRGGEGREITDKERGRGGE